MLNKITHFWHHNHAKQVLSYFLVFLLGAVLAYGITNVSPNAYKGELRIDPESNLRGVATTATVNLEDAELIGGSGSCTKTNCNIINKLNNISKTLSGGITYNGNAASANIIKQIKGAYSNGSFSSWTLDALASHIDAQGAITRNNVYAISKQLGTSSWTLNDIAALINNKCK